AHHVIQSFKPDEVTPEKANQVGLELAKKLAPNHEVAVYTHDDTNHVHNHIAINSVNFETGKKYQDRKSTRLNSSHVSISYAVFCLKKKIIPIDKKAKLFKYTQFANS